MQWARDTLVVPDEGICLCLDDLLWGNHGEGGELLRQDWQTPLIVLQDDVTHILK